MDSGTFWTIVVVGGVVWWAWRANHPKKQAPPTPDGQVYTSNTRKGAELADPFMSNVQATRLAADREGHQQCKQYKAEVEAKVKDDEALKARLSQFAKDNRLDVAFAQLWDELRNYPAWSLRDDFHKWNKLEVIDVGEEPFKDFEHKTLWFTYDGTRYTIKTRRWSGMESEPYQDFTLYEGDDEVFGISAKVVTDYMTYYSPVNITAFKKQGQWATMLVKLFARLQLESEKSSADCRARLASGIKAKFAE